MNSSILLTLLTQKLGAPRSLGKGEYEFFCPNCHHHKKKLQVNLQHSLFHCWVCEYKAKSAYSFFKKFFPDCLHHFKNEKNSLKFTEIDYGYNEQENEKYDDGILKLPPEYTPLFDNSNANTQALRYLKNRGIENGSIKKYQIGFCENGKYRNRIIIPSFDKNNKLNYFIARTIEKENHKRYDNPPIDHVSIIPLESTIDWTYKITVCEGMFDAIRIDHNSIPLLGKNIDFNWLLFQKLKESKVDVYLALDNDMAGIKAMIKISRTFLEYGMNCYYVDISPYHDPAEIPKREFLLKKRDAKLIDEMWLMQKEISLL